MKNAVERVSEAMSHAALLQIREKYGGNQAMQDLIAPLEHRAFAREFAEESPVAAGLSLPFAIPGYAAAKLMGIYGSRTKPSLEQMKQGYIGLGEGLVKAVKK